MLTGVLDAGVDGRGAVFALSRRGRSTRAGRGSAAARTQETPWESQHRWAEAGEMAGGPGTRPQCDSETGTGSPCSWVPRSEKGRDVGSRGVGESGLPEFTPSPLFNTTGQGHGLWVQDTWFHVPASPLPG